MFSVLTSMGDLEGDRLAVGMGGSVPSFLGAAHLTPTLAVWASTWTLGTAVWAALCDGVSSLPTQQIWGLHVAEMDWREHSCAGEPFLAPLIRPKVMSGLGLVH